MPRCRSGKASRVTERLRTTGGGGFSQGKEKAKAEGPCSGNSITDQEVSQSFLLQHTSCTLKRVNITNLAE